MGRSTRSPSPLRKLAVAGLAAAAVLLFAGWGMDGHQSTIEVEGPVARSQLHLFYVTLWVTAFIFVTVGGTLAYTQIKFRAREGDDQKPPPAQTHGHPLVEVGLIVVSILLLVIIAVPTVRGIIYANDTPDPENALVVRVTGYQWWFKFEYPELGLVTANEMVIPAGRPVHVELRTVDVIHSFWVPKLAGKVDLVPNRANHMWLEADQASYYWAQCAEYCGESHANMRFRVVSVEPDDFAAWVDRQKADARNAVATAAAFRPRPQFVAATSDANLGMAGSNSPFEFWQYKQANPPAGTEDPALIAQGRKLFTEKTCLVCHTIRGHEGMGLTGPDLTHVASRTTIAAALLENTPDNLRRWLHNPNAVKPGNIMWREGYVKQNIKLSDDDIEALVAYLGSLK